MQDYHKIFVVLGLGLVFSAPMIAQRKPVANNVSIEIQQNRAIVQYEIKSRVEGSTHLVFLNFIDEEYHLVAPTTLSGNVGPGISSGMRNSIEWDITKDIQQLGSKITPVIFIDGVSKQFSNTGGPRNALLSILMPGLGDYFVADHSLMTFKPYMRTLSSLGLIGLGIYAGNQRYFAEGYYMTVETVVGSYNQQFPADKYKEVYIEGDLQYWLFKGDKEVFISLGAAIWFADILWVLAKGNNNIKFLKASNNGSDFKLGYNPGGISFNYSYTF